MDGKQDEIWIAKCEIYDERGFKYNLLWSKMTLKMFFATFFKFVFVLFDTKSLHYIYRKEGVL